MRTARKAYDEDTTGNARATLEKKRRLLHAEVAYTRQAKADAKEATAARKSLADEQKANFGKAVNPNRNFETMEERDKRIVKETKAKADAHKKALRDAAKKKKAADALMEEVEFARTTSVGAMGGSTISGVSASLGKSLLETAQEQLKVTKKHYRMLEKDRANKGSIWVK